MIPPTTFTCTPGFAFSKPAIVSGAVYNALGQPTGYNLGPAVAANTYWGLPYTSTAFPSAPYGGLRTQLLTGAGGVHLVDRFVGPDPSGNPLVVADNAGEAYPYDEVWYAHDHLDRLVDSSPALGEYVRARRYSMMASP